MSRLRRIENRDRIFFVTTNLVKDVSPFSNTERGVVLEQLKRQRTAGDYFLFGYVVMPTHVHLLLRPDRKDLVAIMYAFKRFTGQEIVLLRKSNGAIWQARYFDFILRRVGDFWDKLEYIHENPVKAGLTSRAENWRWSSAAHYSGSATVPVPVDPFTNFPTDRTAWLYPAPRT